MSITIKTFMVLLVLSPFAMAQAPYFVQSQAMTTTTIYGSAQGAQNVLAPIPYAQIAVCSGTYTGTACTSPTATIYQNSSLTTTYQQPYNTDAQGNYSFWVNLTTSYYYTITGTNVTPQTFVVQAPGSVTGGTISPSTVGCAPTFTTTTNLGGCAGVSTLVTSLQTMQGPLGLTALNNSGSYTQTGTSANTLTGSLSGTSATFSSTMTAQYVNNTASACSFTGTTADAQIAAAFAALGGTGTVDATCYGNASKTLAGPITMASGQILKFSPATSIVPFSASSDVIDGAVGVQVTGLHVDLTAYASTYTGRVIYQGCTSGAVTNNTLYQYISVTGATAAPGNAVELYCDTQNGGLAFIKVDHLDSSGLNNPVLLRTGSNAGDGFGYLNGNTFTNLRLIGSFTSPITAISLVNNGLSIDGNLFDFEIEANSVAGSVGISGSTTGSGSTHGYNDNRFYGNIFDETNPWSMTGTNGGNKFMGGTDVAIADNTSNLILTKNYTHIYSLQSSVASVAGTELPTTTIQNMNYASGSTSGENQLAFTWGTNASPETGSYIANYRATFNQAGWKFYCEFGTNTPSLCATIDSTGNFTVPSNVSGKHLISTGHPTIACGTGAGTGGTCSIAGNDEAGQVTVTTGTSPASNATIATVTLANACPTTVYATARASNAAAASLSGTSHEYPDNYTASTWTITSNSTGLTASTTYTWVYLAACN